MTGPRGVPLSVVVPSAPPVSVLPVALEPDVCCCVFLPVPASGLPGVALSVGAASAPPVRVLAVSPVVDGDGCAHAVPASDPSSSKAATAVRGSEVSMQASGKQGVVICRAAAIRMRIVNRTRETPDRGSCKTFKYRRSFVAELPYLHWLAKSVDYLQTLAGAQRLG
jgi:hypothetical protein